MHVEHGLQQASPRDEVLEAVRHITVDEGHVGRGAAHVEADQPADTQAAADPGHADQAARGPRQHAGDGMKGVNGCEAAVALHQLEATLRIELAQLALQPADIVPQRRRQVRVEHCGVAARDVAHEG